VKEELIATRPPAKKQKLNENGSENQGGGPSSPAKN
jgi:hypothetical protein